MEEDRQQIESVIRSSEMVISTLENIKPGRKKEVGVCSVAVLSRMVCEGDICIRTWKKQGCKL